ncbi:MAG: VOC family protein [Phycisphaerales bacterium]|nr:VOC family protein [Phycisphaerales bacterium]
MNRPFHFEIHVTDPAKSQAFFEKVFGWKFSKWNGPEEFWLVNTGESGSGINGGFLRSRDGQPRTVNTVEVVSVDEACDKVKKAGGQVVVPKMPIPGIGWLAYCTDPGGVLFGVSQLDTARASTPPGANELPA